jgi:AcrR family transcriptional regulator
MPKAISPDVDDHAGERDDNDTQLRILEAGVACIARFGNEKTSIQDVADEAGVSRGTIYRYFEDRATLFAAVGRHEGQRMATAIADRTSPSTTLEELVAIIVEERVAGALRYHTRDHLRHHDRGFAEFFMFGQRRHLEAARKALEPAVRRAKREGELAPGVGVDEATDWIVICLSTVVPLSGATSFDVDDIPATGRFYAKFICHGLER